MIPYGDHRLFLVAISLNEVDVGLASCVRVDFACKFYNCLPLRGGPQFTIAWVTGGLTKIFFCSVLTLNLS